MVQPSLRDAQPLLPPFRGLKSTATFIDRSAVTEESIIQIILQATGNQDVRATPNDPKKDKMTVQFSILSLLLRRLNPNSAIEGQRPGPKAAQSNAP